MNRFYNTNVQKPWFYQKKHGYGWGLPASWQGWIVLLLYLAFTLYEFFRINNHTHSVSDTLHNFIPYFILASAVLVIIVRITSGKPKWHWKNK